MVLNAIFMRSLKFRKPHVDDMSDSQIVQERRKTRRNRVLKTAQIVLNGRATIFECVVRNLTNNGACLEIANTMSIPDEFNLSFDFAKTCRPCRATWRTMNKIGVSFD
jgi:hypothetical protein